MPCLGPRLGRAIGGLDVALYFPVRRALRGLRISPLQKPARAWYMRSVSDGNGVAGFLPSLCASDTSSTAILQPASSSVTAFAPKLIRLSPRLAAFRLKKERFVKAPLAFYFRAADRPGRVVALSPADWERLVWLASQAQGCQAASRAAQVGEGFRNRSSILHHAAAAR